MRNSDSIVHTRRQNIIKLLRSNGRLSIKDISDAFSVSDITIRRDLEVLESQNLVERSHGSVTLHKNLLEESTPKFDDKSTIFTAEKERIARVAALRIQEGDVIFVNAGTTVLYLPKYIRVPHVRIVTNNACMATAEGQDNIELFITGGERYPKTQSLVGDMAIYSLSRINANKCILSVNGITAEQGITSSYYMETSVNFTMLSRCSGERIVIADSSKIGRVFSFVSAGIDLVDTLITDAGADKEELAKLERAGVSVVIAE